MAHGQATHYNANVSICQILPKKGLQYNITVVELLCVFCYHHQYQTVPLMSGIKITLIRTMVINAFISPYLYFCIFLFASGIPVDAVLTKWNSWSSCSVTCSKGMRSRNRSCEPPKYGGEPCSGSWYYL